MLRLIDKAIEVNVAYRWFLGLDMPDPVPHFSTFGKNYTRCFKDTDLFEQIFSRILKECMKSIRLCLISPSAPQVFFFPSKSDTKPSYIPLYQPLPETDNFQYRNARDNPPLFLSCRDSLRPHNRHTVLQARKYAF